MTVRYTMRVSRESSLKARSARWFWLTMNRPGEYGQDIFTLRSTYFQGQVPKAVNMYWRRFAVSSIPLNDAKEFEVWLRDRWTEKDRLLEHITQTGQFPEDIADLSDSKIEAVKSIPETGTGVVNTRVKQSNPFEFLGMFTPLAAFILVLNVIRKLWLMFWTPEIQESVTTA